MRAALRLSVCPHLSRSVSRTGTPDKRQHTLIQHIALNLTQMRTLLLHQSRVASLPNIGEVRIDVLNLPVHGNNRLRSPDKLSVSRPKHRMPISMGRRMAFNSSRLTQLERGASPYCSQCHAGAPVLHDARWELGIGMRPPMISSSGGPGQTP